MARRAMNDAATVPVSPFARDMGQTNAIGRMPGLRGNERTLPCPFSLGIA
jgi:hypothetical protein